MSDNPLAAFDAATLPLLLEISPAAHPFQCSNCGGINSPNPTAICVLCFQVDEQQGMALQAWEQEGNVERYYALAKEYGVEDIVRKREAWLEKIWMEDLESMRETGHRAWGRCTCGNRGGRGGPPHGGHHGSHHAGGHDEDGPPPDFYGGRGGGGRGRGRGGPWY